MSACRSRWELACPLVSAHQPVNLRFGADINAARRLVHYQELGLAGKPFADDNLLAHIEIGDVQLRQQIRRPRFHALPIDRLDAEALLHRRVPHEDIFRHRQLRVQAELLIYRGDAGAVRLARGGEGDTPPIQVDFARIRLINAGDNLDHRGFVGAILADKRMHFAAPHFKMRVLQRVHAGEILVDVPQRQQSAAIRHHACPPGGRISAQKRA